MSGELLPATQLIFRPHPAELPLPHLALPPKTPKYQRTHARIPRH